MTSNRGEKPVSGGSRAAQLRQDIDQGKTGDKVDWQDPATVPLGTDEEAAGTNLDPVEIQKSRDEEAMRGRTQPVDAKMSRSILILLVTGAFCMLLAAVYILSEYR